MNDCIDWTKYRNARGYGVLTRDGRSWLAHRWAYIQARGPIPDGLQLDHLCRNTACVNPDHLEPVTNAENMRRRYATQTRCKRGHEFTEANTYRGAGARACRICQAMHAAAYRKRCAEKAVTVIDWSVSEQLDLMELAS